MLRENWMPEPNTGCLLWLGYCRPDGYVPIGRRKEFAHRIAYEQIHGPIPGGWHVHHLCETPSCVNPRHLQAMPHGDHSILSRGWTFRRHKTHCIHGHSLADAYVWRGHRHCRECRRLQARAA